MSVHRNQSSRARDNRNGVTDLDSHGNYPDGEGQRRGRGGGGSGGGFPSPASQFQQRQHPQQRQQQHPYSSNTAGTGLGSYSHSTSHSPHSNLVHSSSASDSRHQLLEQRSPQQQHQQQQHQQKQHQQKQHHQQQHEQPQEPKLSYVHYLIPPPSPTYFQMVGSNRLSTRIMVIGSNNTGAPPARAGSYDLNQLDPSPTIDTNALEGNISWHQQLSIWMINEGKAQNTKKMARVWCTGTDTWKEPPACWTSLAQSRKARPSVVGS